MCKGSCQTYIVRDSDTHWLHILVWMKRRIGGTKEYQLCDLWQPISFSVVPTYPLSLRERVHK